MKTTSRNSTRRHASEETAAAAGRGRLSCLLTYFLFIIFFVEYLNEKDYRLQHERDVQILNSCKTEKGQTVVATFEGAWRGSSLITSCLLSISFGNGLDARGEQMAGFSVDTTFENSTPQYVNKRGNRFPGSQGHRAGRPSILMARRARRTKITSPLADVSSFILSLARSLVVRPAGGNEYDSQDRRVTRPRE